MRQQLKIYKVKGNPLNPRLIKNDKFKKLVNSIISIPAFMKLRPIILDEDFMVIGGNMRLKAHHHLNRKEIWTDMFTQADCDEMNVLAEKEERETKTYLEYCNEITIKDNVSAGEWEYDMLANEWDSVQLNDFGLDLWENQDDVKEGLIEDDEIPEVKESKVKRGDIWKLGEHRIMCGDSTSSDDVERLMNGDKADMVFTDPPYGISVVGNIKKGKGGVGGGKPITFKGSIGKGVLCKEGSYRPVIGDDKDFDPRFLLKLSDNIVIWGANYFSNLLPIGQWIVWDKNRPKGTTFSDCELAWTNGKGIAIKKYECTWNGMTREGESGKRVHPTQKPLKICAEILSDFSENKDLILDLFLGSGSTLIAAEKLKRKCYGMELDEKYCDVIIERWEQFTGLKAIKNGTK